MASTDPENPQQPVQNQRLAQAPSSSPIYRSGSSFSDQSNGGKAYTPGGNVNVVSSSFFTGAQDRRIGQPRSGGGPIERAVTNAPRIDQPPAAGGPSIADLSARAVSGQSMSNAQNQAIGQPAPGGAIYRNGNSFSDQANGARPYTPRGNVNVVSPSFFTGGTGAGALAQQAIGQQAGGGEPSVTDRYARATAIYQSMSDGSSTQTQRIGQLAPPAVPESRYQRRVGFDGFERLEAPSDPNSPARMQQAQDWAASTATENAISQRNGYEEAARRARQAAGSLRLTPGGRTQRQLLGKVGFYEDQAEEANGRIGTDARFISSPEEQAHADLMRRQGIAQGIEANARMIEAQASAQKIGQLPAESWRDPVAELDQNGRPILAQYGSQGSRRLIDGAQPANGGAGPKLTEQQSKDLGFYTRGTEALKNLGDGAALTSYLSKAGASIPGVGNSLTSNDYQKQQQAGREVLAAILRKDTGAAITDKEMELYGKTYLPQPGDSADTLQQKANARQTAMQAIKAGMGPAQGLVPQDRQGWRPGSDTDVPDSEDEEQAPKPDGPSVANRNRAEAERQQKEALDARHKRRQRGYTDFSHLWGD